MALTRDLEDEGWRMLADFLWEELWLWSEMDYSWSDLMDKLNDKSWH